MEYILMLGGLAQNIGGNIKMSLQAAYDKMFANPLLLALVAGGLILLGLWALKTSR